jgi:endonuclease YncB( thermonuclease family)
VAGEVWALPVAVVQVVDGDTLELNYNLGFNMRRSARARLLGVNTAEVFGVDPRTAKAAEGHKQAEWVRAWVAAGAAAYKGSWPFVASCEGFDKYGRDLERRSDGAQLAAAIVAEFPSARMG